jgi:hypothetical protein
MNNCAYYPGAGTDIVPPIMFRSIKMWYYMDSQPNSEFGDDLYEGFSRPQFIPQLIQVMNQNDFEFKLKEKDVYTFYNSTYGQTIRYETNAVFPKALQPYHIECNSLVLCGYELSDPPKDFITSYPHIITDTKTCHEQLLATLDACNISTMIYDKHWKYWKDENLTIRKIQRYVKVTEGLVKNIQ